MYTVERRRMLVDRARQTGRVDVSGMSGELGLAPETIRRDLRDLELQGLIRRVHGGAVPVERPAIAVPLAVRSTVRPAQDRRIAAAAATYLACAESIYLDEGFLPGLIGEHLPPERCLTVVTPSLAIAAALVKNSAVTVLLVGGRIRAETLGTIDHWAESMLKTLVLDLAFLGADGISAERGVSVSSAGAAAVKKAAMDASRRRILVGDSSKYGTDSFVDFARLDEFERFVTDDGLPAGRLAPLHARGVEVTRV